MNGLKIPFSGIRRQYNSIREQILDVTDEVLRSGNLMNGNYTVEFESWLARRNHMNHAVTCHSGTQALEILAAWWARDRDTPPVLGLPTLSYPASANAFQRAGWRLYFFDTDQYGLADFDQLDPSTLFDAIMLVGLHGAAIREHWRDTSWIGRMHWTAIHLFEDAAQHWLSANCRRAGTAAALSFDPTKNFNSYGNGGAIVTSNLDLAEWARAWRDNGKPDHHMPGTNSRMSEIDCAQMLVKSTCIDAWQQRRRKIAEHWILQLRDSGVRCLVDVSNIDDHALQRFVIDVDDRDRVQSDLGVRGIETRVHYGRPLHELSAFRDWPAPGMLSRASSLCRRVLSLPIYPELTDLEVEFIADQVRDCVSKARS